MAIPTVALNESTPSGSNYIREGDDRIKEYKLQVREIMEIDHVFPSSGQDATCGKHKQVSLIEAADIGTGAGGLPILGAETVSDKPELMYKDEDDNHVQITKLGKLNPTDILPVIYPVGSIYCNASVATNPGTLLGFGTWSAFGAGRVMIGDGGGYTAEATGGEATHLLTSAESGLVAHNHDISAGIGENASVSRVTGTNDTEKGTANTNNNTAADAVSAHNNLQPYIVVYMWVRTA
jgi:hypothetical protein